MWFDKDGRKIAQVSTLLGPVPEPFCIGEKRKKRRRRGDLAEVRLQSPGGRGGRLLALVECSDGGLGGGCFEHACQAVAELDEQDSSIGALATRSNERLHLCGPELELGALDGSHEVASGNGSAVVSIVLREHLRRLGDFLDGMASNFPFDLRREPRGGDLSPLAS